MRFSGTLRACARERWRRRHGWMIMHARNSRPRLSEERERKKRESEGLKCCLLSLSSFSPPREERKKISSRTAAKRELSFLARHIVMLRARRASSSAAASALEALLFGQAKVLTPTGNLQSTSTSSAFAAFSSSASSQQPLSVPWTSRGEFPPSTSTGGEATEIPAGAAFAGEMQTALIIGGRQSSESPTLSSSLFAAASPFQSSLWQQQRRWMAVPKKKVREEKIKTEQREWEHKNSGA